MAGAVLSRTCFFTRVGGTIRPYEWALINVGGFGPMVETFWPFESRWTNPQSAGVAGRGNDDFSSASDSQRIDEFVEADDGLVIAALNSGVTENWMIGGRHYPRSGR